MNVYQHLYPKFGNDAVWMCVYLLCALVCWRSCRREKTGKRNNSSHRAKAFTSKTISCSFFMLFINALCVVCATINSSKNGCFSDYTEKWSIFPSFCTRILFGSYCAAVFWEWKEREKHLISILISKSIPKDAMEENYAHTRLRIQPSSQELVTTQRKVFIFIRANLLNGVCCLNSAMEITEI